MLDFHLHKPFFDIFLAMFIALNARTNFTVKCRRCDNS